MDYNTHSPIAKGVWDHFDDHVVRTVHIGIELFACRGHERATLDPFSCVLLQMRQGFTIEEAAFAGVGLLGHDHRNANELGLVGQHLDEAGMGEEDEGLVGALPQVHPLFPPIIVPDDQGADAVLDEIINDPAAGDVR